MIRPRHAFAALALLFALSACDQQAKEAAGTVPGDKADSQAFGGITPDETIRFTGTEPFWGGESVHGRLTYSTPEQPEGTAIAVERFAGRGGLSLNGELGGAPFVMAVTPGTCSDGMSDRTYPFTVTLKVEGGERQGCAWTDSQPASGEEHP